MPSTSRLAILRDGARNHPIIVAAGAATGGVLLGTFVAVQLFATPAPHSDSASPPQAMAQANTAPPIAETTGSGVSEASAPPVNCAQQTWPYVSQGCMDEPSDAKRDLRLVTTDKVNQSTINAIEGPAESQAQKPTAESLPPAPHIAEVPPPEAVTAANDVVPLPRPAPEPKIAASESSPADADAQARTSKAEEKRVARKTASQTRRKYKSRARDNDDDNEFAQVDSARRYERSGRQARRWNERSYDVPADNGNGQRVIVIRRRGALFDDLFGDF